MNQIQVILVGGISFLTARYIGAFILKLILFRTISYKEVLNQGYTLRDYTVGMILIMSILLILFYFDLLELDF